MEEKVRHGGPWGTVGWARPSSEVGLSLLSLPSTHLCLSRSVSMVVLVSPALPHADAFPFLLQGCSEREGEEWRILERCLLCYQDSALRILERLHLGKSSRENKLQIPANMGKGSCSRRQLRGPWQRLRRAWPLPLMDPTWSLPGPMVLHGLQRRFRSQALTLWLWRSCCPRV